MEHTDPDDGADRVNFPLRMPRRLRERLKAEARRQGISANAVVLLTLDRQLPEYDPRKQ